MNDKTVIISCAGIGSRLGMGKPKALIDIEGETLILRTLKMLDNVEDVRIVVGFQAEEVIKAVTAYRRDITFVYNHNYLRNGTGASVSLAKEYSKRYFLTIDGDIVIHPDDMKKILSATNEFVGVCAPSTDDPVLTIIDKNDKVIGFSREEGKYEWTGVTLLESRRVKPTDGHVYQFIEPLLPLDYKLIRIREVDTPNDYQNAIAWVANGFKD